MKLEPENQITFYETEDGKVRVEVYFEDENVWLTQKLMAELFETTVANINIHLKNIFDEHELIGDSAIKESLITANDGKKYKTKYIFGERIGGSGSYPEFPDNCQR